MKRILFFILLLAPSVLFSGWMVQSSGVSNHLNGIFFYDANNGYVCGNNGIILRTTNGGAHWDTVHTGIYDPHLNDIFFATVNEGWAVGNSGKILHSTDGGQIWKDQDSGGSFWITSAWFVDEDVGRCVTKGGRYIHTSNGGSNWITDVVTGNDLYGVYFYDANKGWICGTSGYIGKTTNGGSSWTDQRLTPQTLHSLSFTDAAHGWTCGTFGTIFHTTDGDTWISQTSNVSNDLYGIAFVDTNNGWAVGSFGKIIHTTDGGANWFSDTSGVEVHLNDVCFVDANNGWACGNGGTILRYTSVGIEETESLKFKVESLKLYPCYPNPFHSFTVIRYSLFDNRTPITDDQSNGSCGHAVLKIFDISGRLVRTLPITKNRQPITEVIWDGKDSDGKSLPSGIYFHTIHTDAQLSAIRPVGANNFQMRGKVVLLR